MSNAEFLNWVRAIIGLDPIRGRKGLPTVQRREEPVVVEDGNRWVKVGSARWPSCWREVG